MPSTVPPTETSPPSVWIVVPAYCEEPRIAATLQPFLDGNYQVVVVDDGSPDSTAAIVERLPVWLVRHAVNCGQGASIQTGIEFALAAGADIIVTFDGDGQHSVEDVPAMVEPIQNGHADVTLGSRFLGSTVAMPLARGFLLRLAVVFTWIVSQIRVTDTHNGLRAFSRVAASRIRIRQNRMAHASEILDEIGRLKLRYVEVPVTVTYHAETLEKGQSGWNAVRISADLLLGRVLK